MSTYLIMWAWVRSLSKKECQDWINLLSPATGRSTKVSSKDHQFMASDVDILEALRFHLNDESHIVRGYN